MGDFDFMYACRLNCPHKNGCYLSHEGMDMKRDEQIMSNDFAYSFCPKIAMAPVIDCDSRGSARE